MRIIFPIFSDKVSRYKFKIGDTNPGIGGTQFTTIQLAMRLAVRHKHWSIVLLNKFPIQFEEEFHNISTQCHEHLSSFLTSCENANECVIVSTVQSFRGTSHDLLRKFGSRVILWSRHPYDETLRNFDSSSNFGATVSVGRYQFYSNQLLRSPHFFIQNIFAPPLHESREIRNFPFSSELRLVHLGALVWGKDFLKIAQQWRSIRTAFPNARLDVIGGGDLYRTQTLHPLIPALPKFGDEILEYIDESDIRSGHVQFHGSLGSEKFEILKKAHIALQNPTGRTEAFPASTLECMSTGLPVIASADFGMWDSMRSFPELQVTSPRDITSRIEWLLEDEKRYLSVSKRALEVARTFASMEETIVQSWEKLILGVVNGDARSVKLPVPERPRSQTHFLHRIAIRHGRMILSNGMLGSLWRKLKPSHH